MTEASEDVCSECGADWSEDDYTCDRCDLALCEKCAERLMVGDDSTQYVYCSTCQREVLPR